MCKRLGINRLYGLHESKLLSVSNIEFCRSKLASFSVHVSGAAAAYRGGLARCRRRRHRRHHRRGRAVTGADRRRQAGHVPRMTATATALDTMKTDRHISRLGVECQRRVSRWTRGRVGVGSAEPARTGCRCSGRDELLIGPGWRSNATQQLAAMTRRRRRRGRAADIGRKLYIFRVSVRRNSLGGERGRSEGSERIWRS